MATNNATILKSVWLNGTNDFQQRVPAPTQSNIAQVSAALFDPMNRDIYNQFCDNLINRIGNQYIHNKLWKSPLREFIGNSLNYGNTIQEIAVNYVRAHSFAHSDRIGGHEERLADPFADTVSILDTYKPDIESAYHSRNRQDVYPISFNDTDVRTAFVDEFGLNSFIAAVMSAPQNGDEIDTYNIMNNLFAEYNSYQQMFTCSLETDPTKDDNAKELMRRVREYTGRLRFPSALYNSSRVNVPVFANTDELVLFTTPEVESYIDVNVLASIFNIPLADVNVRRIILDNIMIPNSVAILTTKDFFVCNDTFYGTTSFYNPASLSTNYYLHHQGVYSTSPFAPVINFSFGTPATIVPVVKQTVTGVRITPVESVVDPGSEVALTVELVGELKTNPEPMVGTDPAKSLKVAPESVIYHIAIDNGDDQALKNNVLTDKTYVDKYGVLHVQDDLVGGSVLKITAISTYHNPSVVMTEGFNPVATCDISLNPHA